MFQTEEFFSNLYGTNATSSLEAKVISPSGNVGELRNIVEKSKLIYDPIGDHLIKLRQFYFELNELVNQAEEVKKNKNARMFKEDMNLTKSLKKLYLPEFPENYPFSNPSTLSNVCEHKIRKISDGIAKKEVNEMMESSVKKILFQNGFYVNDLTRELEPIKCLSYFTQIYLEKFVEMMIQNKKCEVFTGSYDLWGSLETTLREIECDGIPGFKIQSIKNYTEVEIALKENSNNAEFGGIAGLHAFYYEMIVKKHDKLFKKCKILLEKYEKLLFELNVNGL